MTVRELYSALEKDFPASLRCSWDNDGLLLSPDTARKVLRVLTVLDVNPETVEKAVSGGYDLIVSHHPLFFSINSLNPEETVGNCCIRLLSAGISVFSFHTRLDAAKGGVNDLLAEILSLADVETFGPQGEAMGRIGVLPIEMSLSVFASLVKDKLGADNVRFADAGRSVRRVAVLGGEGKEYLPYAIAAGADTYLSGAIGYHKMDGARAMRMNTVEAGHFYTEAPVCAVLAGRIRHYVPDAVVDIFTSNPIESV